MFWHLMTSCLPFHQKAAWLCPIPQYHPHIASPLVPIPQPYRGHIFQMPVKCGEIVNSSLLWCLPPPPRWHFSQPNHFTPQTPSYSSVPSFTFPTPNGGGPLAFLLLCPGGMQHYPLVMSQLHEHTHMWQERGSVWDRGYLRASQSHMLPLLLGVKLLCSQKEPSDYFTQEHCVKVCVTVSIQVYLFICTVLDIC